MKTPTPRIGNYYGMKVQPITFPDGTWIEGEEWSYPNDTFTRRALVNYNDIQVLAKCCCADSFFTIPARLKENGKTIKGYLTCDEDGVTFHKSIFVEKK